MIEKLVVVVVVVVQFHSDTVADIAAADVVAVDFHQKIAAVADDIDEDECC